MDVTEVRIKLVNDAEHRRLKAFCSVTIDGCFVVRDIKIVDGAHGLFVAMPSRKKTEHCPSCRSKVAITAQYCEHCGRPIHRAAPTFPGDSYVDVAHPITPQCRERLEQRILDAYQQALKSGGESGDYAAITNFSMECHELAENRKEEKDEDHEGFGAGIF